ncbi:MAG: hypothetical protein NTX97_05020 [Bacteroidetes bacterium]|nr:hypothetical protein [Bacteroidota bacterium]
MKFKLMAPAVIFLGLFCFTIIGNVENIQGHLLEMNNRYKGPLDFTIPFIQENFKNTENLVIAANYEETSYMYYLKSKVIIGYVGNNLQEDFQVTPQVIAYRIPWRNHLNIFSQMLNRVPYYNYTFPVYDYQVNNYAELNYNFPEFNFYMNHQFVTRLPADPMFATELFIKR